MINWLASTILDRESDKHQTYQGSSTHPKGGIAYFYEPGRGQLHTEPHIRLISCQVASLLWQEPEEELNKLLLMKVSERDRNIKGKYRLVQSDIIFHAGYPGKW